MHLYAVYTVYKPVTHATICCWGVTVQIGAIKTCLVKINASKEDSLQWAGCLALMVSEVTVWMLQMACNPKILLWGSFYVKYFAIAFTFI